MDANAIIAGSCNIIGEASGRNVDAVDDHPLQIADTLMLTSVLYNHTSEKIYRVFPSHMISEICLKQHLWKLPR